MQDGVLLANAGHFDMEVDLDALSDLAVDTYEARDGVQTYEMADGRRLNVLAEGRLVNLASPIALGHPVEVMDQSSACRPSSSANSSRTATTTTPVSTRPGPTRQGGRGNQTRRRGCRLRFPDRYPAEYMDSWQHGTYEFRAVSTVRTGTARTRP